MPRISFEPRETLLGEMNISANTKNWEATFQDWARGPSAAEKTRCETMISHIKAAVRQSPLLSSRQIKTFVQGSYRNRVNVSHDSDVDMGIMLHDYFLPQYPSGKTRADFGHIDAGYSFSQFKEELGGALLAYFGPGAVVRGNKAFKIYAPRFGVEVDAVALFEFRKYSETGFAQAGTALIPDNHGKRIENYPEILLPDKWPNTPLHYENGVSKNEATGRAFKGVVRILKRLRAEMELEGWEGASKIPGYLIECLAWNASSDCFESNSWADRVDSVLLYLYKGTKEDIFCKNWTEVDAIKFLFRRGQPWLREDAYSFLDEAWRRLHGGWQA